MLSGIVASVAVWKAMAEANARLHEDRKFSLWWWTLSKHARLWKEHKRLCPESHLRIYAVLSFGVGIVFAVLIAVFA